MTTHPMLLVTQQGPWKDIKIEANDYFKEKNQIKLRYLAQNSPFTGGEKKKTEMADFNWLVSSHTASK